MWFSTHENYAADYHWNRTLNPCITIWHMLQNKIWAYVVHLCDLVFFQEQSYAQNGEEESSKIENSLILYCGKKTIFKLKEIFIKTKPIVDHRFEHCKLKLKVL